MNRKHVLVESEGIIHAHRRGADMKGKEQELRTVTQPRKPGQGTPQNPPPPKDKPKK